MRPIVFALAAVAALAGLLVYIAPVSGQADREVAPIFEIKTPPGYRDWKLISVAHEEGSLNDLRAILGNDIALKASREGKLPYPDGAIIARIAWRYDPLAGKRKSLWSSPIVRGRAAQERGSVHGQGLNEIRLDRRLGVRSIRWRQTRQRGSCTTPALPATRSSKIATSSSTVMRLEPRVGCDNRDIGSPDRHEAHVVYEPRRATCVCRRRKYDLNILAFKHKILGCALLLINLVRA